MPKINPQAVRLRKAADLRMLGEVLQSEAVCEDIGPLLQAADRCTINTPYGQKSWGYQLNNLRFKLESGQRVRPSGLTDINIALSIDVAGQILDPPAIDQIFLQMAIDFVVSGVFVKDDGRRQVLACWHLDRHILGEAESTGAVHPLYHFQYGGWRMEGIDDFGHTLLLDTPRLLHPPMDACIAIDFLLANFLPSKWRVVKQNGAYANRISGAYKEYWSPFFEAVADAWRSAPNRSGLKFSILAPQL